MIINKHTSRPSKQSFQQILTKSYDNNLPNKRSSATLKTSSSMKKITEKHPDLTSQLTIIKS